MSTEEKARAYDEALKKIKGYVKDGYGCTRLKPEDIFPELKESEDERMLREIKEYIKLQGNKPSGLPTGSVSVSDMIAWLEKQKPVEWTHHDAVHFDATIRDLESIKPLHDSDHIMRCETINWLKSLKQRISGASQSTTC